MAKEIRESEEMKREMKIEGIREKMYERESVAREMREKMKKENSEKK